VQFAPDGTGADVMIQAEAHKIGADGPFLRFNKDTFVAGYRFNVAQTGCIPGQTCDLVYAFLRLDDRALADFVLHKRIL